MVYTMNGILSRLTIVIIIVILSHPDINLIQASSKFIIQIKNYRKQSNRKLNGECCGEADSLSRAGSCNVSTVCPLKFRICLEYPQSYVDLQTPEPYKGPCVYGNKDTEFWGNTHMQFSSDHAWRYHLVIAGAWPGEVQIIVEVNDDSRKSIGKYNIIDRFVYHNIIQSRSSRSDADWYTLTKSNGATSYTLRFSLTCDKYYYGPNCDKYCNDERPNMKYLCNKNGDMVCKHGWMGSNCNTSVCKPGCNSAHGYCNKPGECKCVDGWTGEFCDQCMKFPGCKHGSCINSPWTCFCDKNWAGSFCDKNLNYCAEERPCKNGGICENQASETDPYKCICSSGYRGKDCEIDICKPNPCKKGECFKSKHNFYCQCFSGWTGKYCDKDTTICDKNSCKNGGKCTKDSFGELRCDCPRGFKGSECHIADPCDNSKCKHAIDCEVKSISQGRYSCRCQEGWTGEFCDKNINDCKINICKNDGICEDLVNDYRCKCKKGFKGKHCEINVVCGSNQLCQNGGVCQETETDFICKCKKGYSGKNCEVHKTGCSPNPCLNHAYCYPMESNDFFCPCKTGYYGKRCEHQRPYCGKQGSCDTVYDACHLPIYTSSTTQLTLTPVEMHSLRNITQVCGPYGTCISEANGEQYRCECQAGFTGSQCQKNINDCETNPCRNNGVCIDDVNDYHCLCEAGFDGKQCEIELDMCASKPCLNGGICRSISSQYSINNRPDFECECSPSWAGRLCHQPHHKPCGDKPCLHEGKCISDPNRDSGFKCSCQPGWFGSVCQYQKHAERPCQVLVSRRGSSCMNGGVCFNVGENPEDFICNCRPGYEGRMCENNVNECNPNPCFNGGNCTDLTNSYKCHCPPGFYGTNCQSNRDECASFPCAYGSVCVDRIKGFECRCPVGRKGVLCDQVIDTGAPKPPSCLFENRIFDSGKSWTFDCQNCTCDNGKTICKNMPCGVWSCLQASGHDDPYACKPSETCFEFPYDPQRCFVPPCVKKGQCIRNGDPDPPSQVNRLWPPVTNSYQCHPNTRSINNHCTKLRLRFIKKNIQVGVTVDDICDLIKNLRTIQKYRTRPEGQNLAMSCDIDSMDSDMINIALYSSSSKMLYLKSTRTHRPFIHYLSDKIADEAAQLAGKKYTIISGLLQIRVDTKMFNPDNQTKNYEKYLLIPIVIIGFALIIFLIFYHKKKMQEIKKQNNNLSGPAKYNNSQTNFNNSKYGAGGGAGQQQQLLFPQFGNHGNKVTKQQAQVPMESQQRFMNEPMWGPQQPGHKLIR